MGNPMCIQAIKKAKLSVVVVIAGLLFSLAFVTNPFVIGVLSTLLVVSWFEGFAVSKVLEGQSVLVSLVWPLVAIHDYVRGN